MHTGMCAVFWEPCNSKLWAPSGPRCPGKGGRGLGVVVYVCVCVPIFCWFAVPHVLVPVCVAFFLQVRVDLSAWKQGENSLLPSAFTLTSTLLHIDVLDVFQYARGNIGALLSTTGNPHSAEKVHFSVTCWALYNFTNPISTYIWTF